MTRTASGDLRGAFRPRGHASPHQHLSLFADRLIISAGTTQPATRVSGTGPLQRGLKVVVILNGRESVKLEGHPSFEISGPQSCVILNGSDSNQVEWAASDIPLRFVVVQVLPSFAENEMGIDIASLMKQLGTLDRPLLHFCSESQILESLAAQIVTCPIRGPMRNVYLAGKGLELVASAIDPMMQGSIHDDQKLSPIDLKRVHAAHDRLVRSLNDPPSLAELSRESGLSTSKLTLGFRRAFGTTVFAILQEHRLQRAYSLLSSGQTSVSDAAYQVGYSPAHFATIFRQRFGVSPSKLRRGSGN